MPSSHTGGPHHGAPLAVLLPGSGSDEIFLRTAFRAPLRALGISLCTGATGSVDAYFNALDDAARRSTKYKVPLLVGGVSLGAQVAARWAAGQLAQQRNPVAGLLLAMPGWTGAPGGAAAALAASATAASLRRHGLAATIADTRANTPAWLGDELARAWTRHDSAGKGSLADSLDTAAGTAGPTRAELAALRVPVALTAMTDDPIHPLAVARDWHATLPHSALVTTTLAALGGDPESLGRATALAWQKVTRTGSTREGC
ncbi:MAG TPA: alpha/beta hydrolase [Pseudonocardia sp.]|uniref:alpha/beta hydrolase n=1 Tax=Pseudonocardia sp. TaxID=60912 RepID=UPI002F3F7E76